MDTQNYQFPKQWTLKEKIMDSIHRMMKIFFLKGDFLDIFSTLFNTAVGRSNKHSFRSHSQTRQDLFHISRFSISLSDALAFFERKNKL